MVQQIRVRIKGRFVKPLMIDNIYEIVDYDDKIGQVKLRLLKDPNGILIRKNNTFGVAQKMIRATLLDKLYQLMPQKEEYAMRESMANDKVSKIVIKYSILDLGDGQIECLPQSMIPEGLSMHHYDIKFNKNERRIESVNHNQYGPVEFESQLLDD